MTVATPLATQLAEFATAATPDSLGETLRAIVRDRVTDSVGVSLAALGLDTSRAAVSLVRLRGGSAQADILGESGQVPAAAAAFANGVFAHSLDFDDTHLPSILHPSASVVPAALAAAQASGAAGADLIAAIAVGLEVCVRIGIAGYDPRTNANIWFDRGQHATSICGTMGAAVAAAKVSGLDAEGVRHALAISASMASGVIEANRGGGTVKRMHCGWAAQAGITAAELAAHGVTGPATVLEGRFGVLQAFLGDHVDHAAVVEGLGTAWRVPEIQVKPYPANHFTHTVLDAAAVLRERGVRPDDIESIVVGVPTSIVRTIGEPIEAKRAPETAYQAQFSAPYAVCLGLFGGHALGASLDDYTEEVARDPRRRALMAKVSVEPNSQCDDIYPYEFPSVLEARLHDGRVERCQVLANRGGARRPLTSDQLAEKFLDNAARALPPDGARELVHLLGRLDEVDDLSTVFALARKS